MKKLTAHEILAVDDRQTLDVMIPEWGPDCGVTLRSLSAAEAADFVDAFNKNKKDSALEVMVLSVVDETGKPIFTKADIAQLRTKSLRAVQRIQTAVMELNGLADAKKTQDTAKNDSGEAPSGASPTV